MTLMPEFLSKFISENRDLIIISLMAGILLLLFGFLVLLSRLGKLNRKYSRLTRNTSGGNLEEILHGHLDNVNGVLGRIEALETRAAGMETSQRRCLQKFGMIRYDAFEDVGGEQSFAVVLLDDDHNGVSFSSVYSRNDVRIYAKAIKNGIASYKLTEEEQKALALADGKQ